MSNARSTRRLSPVSTTVATVLSLPPLVGLAHAGETDPTKAPDTVKLETLDVEGEAAKPLSSPKFSEPIRDTPQTLVVVPKLVIEQQGAQTLSDVLRNTPGITFAAGEGGNVAAGDSFFMRGFDSSGSIFIDGVRDTGNYTRDVFNFEQVEIAKGPAGADSGRGGSSGYVNLVTKTPTLQRAHTITGLVGSDDQYRSTIDLNEPLSLASVPGAAVRLNALWQDSGVPGRKDVENSSWAVAPSLVVGLGTPTRVVVAASHLQQDNLPDSGLPVVALPSGVLYPSSVAAPTQSVNQENFYGLENEDFDHIKVQTALARVEHDVSKSIKLSNQTKVARNHRDSLTSYIQSSAVTASTFAAATTPVNPATGAPPASYVSYVPATATVTPRRTRVEQTNTVVSNQTNASLAFETGPVAHALNTGLEFTREWQFTPTWQATGGPSTNLYTPDAGRSATVAQTPYKPAGNPYAQSRTDTDALYLFDTLKFGPRWSLNLSTRAERYRTDYSALSAATPSAPAQVYSSLSANDTIYSHKAGLVFKPAPAGSLYVAYGNSSTPPGSGFTLSATASNQNNPNLDPQETENLEAGVKWDFVGGRLSTSLAVFSTENKNVVSTDVVTGLVTQDISQKVEGVEFGISGRITERWLVFGGLGYLDSKYEAAGTTSAANDGASLRFTPRLSGSLWTTYILPFNLTVGAGAQYSDSVVRSTANGGPVAGTSPSVYSVPEYWLFSAMADYAFSRNLSVRLNVQNLTDEDYFRLNNNGGRYYPGVARSYTLSATWKF